MKDLTARDIAEGRYTQMDPEGPEERRVAGRYTGAGAPGEEEIVGAYVGSQRDHGEPEVRDVHLRHGDYTRAEHEPEHEHEHESEHQNAHAHEHEHKHRTNR